jgi:hypothetical protein
MNMGNRARITFAAFLALSCTGTLAQSTLGELIDAGFRKMTKDDFAATVIGAKVSSYDAAGTLILADYKADGTFSGAWYQQGGGLQGVYSGTWTIDESGKECWKSKNLWWNTEGCRFWFRNGDQIYSTSSETERDSRIFKRTVKR